jgi:hypothetical protein
MSFKAQLDIAGVVSNILDVKYELYQEVDASGRPSSVSRGGQIEITIESTASDKFIAACSDSFERLEGSIKYLKRDTNATLKELKFKEAYVVRYKEHFSSTGENPLTETFVLSAREISMGNMTFANEWV